MSNRYGLYGCAFSIGEGDLALPQVRSIGTRMAKNMASIHASGSLDPSAHLLSTARPVIQIATHDFATLFGDADAPVSITDGADVDGGATFMYRRRLPGGAYAVTNLHSVQLVEAGFLHVTEISASADSQDPAEATLEFVALSNDGGNPFTFTDDQAIPGDLAAPSFVSAFYHGPAYFNSSQLPGLIRTTVRPGIEHTARYCDGGSFPRRLASSINRRSPSIELQFLKVDMADSIIGDLVTAAFSNTLAVYFQRGSTNKEGRVAAATTQHLKISAAAGSWGADDVSVADEDDATLTLMVQPTGTLSLSVASAIP
jgi:hypothetical protein